MKGFVVSAGSSYVSLSRVTYSASPSASVSRGFDRTDA